MQGFSDHAHMSNKTFSKDKRMNDYTSFNCIYRIGRKKDFEFIWY